VKALLCFLIAFYHSTESSEKVGARERDREQKEMSELVTAVHHAPLQEHVALALFNRGNHANWSGCHFSNNMRRKLMDYYGLFGTLIRANARSF
jgi:hypothetical protein